MKTGIYLILNTVTGTAYVGQAQNIEKRFKEHKGELRRNNHYNSRLQRSYNKYGLENFTFATLEIVSNIKHLTGYENSYLDYYRSLPGGTYNAPGPAEFPSRGIKRSKEYVKRMSDRLKGRPSPKRGKSGTPHTVESRKKLQDAQFKKAIEAIDDTGNIVKKYKSLKDAERDGYHRANIRKCINGICKTCNGLFWRYSDA